MYDYLKGHVASKTPTATVIDVGGVGYLVEVSLRTSELMPPSGKPVLLWTHYKIHEDRARLFGFVDPEERELFRTLISVAGVGPAHGLALLSGYDPVEIWEKIRNQDAKGLARTKGIGPKIAQRVCVELAEKAQRQGLSQQTAPDQRRNSALEDAISALLVLGYTETQARKAADAAAAKLPPDAALEDVVREALRNT